jgi:leader peptidase (prepilin peptidase)/N-methyltransferase
VNVLLDVGCGAAGAVAGYLLYDVAAAVPPFTPGQSTELSAGAPEAEVVATNGHPTPPEPVALPPELTPPPPPPSALERLAAVVATAALFVGTAIRFGPVPAVAPYCVFFAGLVLLSVTDLRVGLVPRRLLYPWLVLVAAGLLGASWADGKWHELAVAALCGVGTFAVFFAVWFVYPKGMGFGDVRLAGVIGLALGWLGVWHVYIGLFAGFAVGVIAGLVVMIANRSGRKTRIRFAPALSLGATVSVFWGSSIITAWMGHGS